jgi:hypothetical protein
MINANKTRPTLSQRVRAAKDDLFIWLRKPSPPKSQTPNPKSQTNQKIKYPMTKTKGRMVLDLLISFFEFVWDLGFGI